MNTWLGRITGPTVIAIAIFAILLLITQGWQAMLQFIAVLCIVRTIHLPFVWAWRVYERIR